MACVASLRGDRCSYRWVMHAYIGYVRRGRWNRYGWVARQAPRLMRSPTFCGAKLSLIIITTFCIRVYYSSGKVYATISGYAFFFFLCHLAFANNLNWVSSQQPRYCSYTYTNCHAIFVSSPSSVFPECEET